MPSQNKERIGAEKLESPERFVRNLLGGLSGKGQVQDALAMLRHLREREKSKPHPPLTLSKHAADASCRLTEGRTVRQKKSRLGGAGSLLEGAY